MPGGPQFTEFLLIARNGITLRSRDSMKKCRAIAGICGRVGVVGRAG